MTEARRHGGQRRGPRGRWLWTLAAAYAALLVASWGASWGPTLSAERGDRRALLVAQIDAEGAPVDGVAAVAFLEEGTAQGPPLVLLHGSPGSADDFRRLAPALAPNRRLITPDLPGFGASEREVPDYSARAHAGYVQNLLRKLGIDRYHVLGFSMGGAVALELAERAPDEVLSVTLLASLGVEELELLGEHTLNHGLHGLQLGAIEVARWALPHFGAHDRGMLTRQYARNFFDTDQRRLRPLLETLRPPTLILHGEDDFLVPVAAAHEHARLVAQAELTVLPSPRGHFIPWTEPELIAELVGDFIARVDVGGATPRSAASPERLASAAAPFDPRSVPPFEGPAWLAVLVLLALGTLISEDLSCIAGGLLVADGRLGFVAAAGACFVGIFIGDLALFALGRLVGRPALAARPLRWVVSEAAVERASRWFKRRGVAVIFLSRFTPGLRLPTYVAAGLLRTPLGTFAGFFALAGLLWTPLLVGVAAVAGETLARELGDLGLDQLPWLLGLAFALMQVYRTAPLAMTHGGRRRLRGRWLRLTRWEFWPPYLTYPPVLAWILWLAVRHRSLAVVTAANPGIPASGVVGESKAMILEALQPGAPEIAGHALLSASATPDERERVTAAFLSRHDPDFPVVVKPDAGQRGSGVRMAPDQATLLRWARAVRHDTIVQERIDGPEFGVFYARPPSEERGRVLGVTTKVMPSVVGDGRRTVEALLLDDDRACALHSVYLEELGAGADEVPLDGVEVPLVQVGTHARGAIFLNGSHLITPALEAAVERIARRFEGFHLGRFDVRAPSEAHLARGEGLGVIELNGLTSEPTEIYDPAMSLRDAYGKLFEQWRLAFEIGAENVQAGAAKASLISLFKEWTRYMKSQRTHSSRPSGSNTHP